MRIDYTLYDIEREINKFIIEEDDIMFIGEYIEGEGVSFVITGSAIIEGEKYNNFKLEIELMYKLEKPSAEEIMSAEWDWYDYLI